MQNKLQQTYGNIDIYLFDQLLKGRYDNAKKVLDVGCGHGRNLFYFLRNGYEVFGIDSNKQAIETVKELSTTLALVIPWQILWFAQRKTYRLAMRHLTWLFAARYYILQRMRSILTPCCGPCSTY
jgi:SAM-dependent methyltransferase